MSDPVNNIKVQVINKTASARRFIVFQKDVQFAVSQGKIYVWASRKLDQGGGSWFFGFPMGFLAAGAAGDPASGNYSTTAILSARYGQTWELIQTQANAPFTIETSVPNIAPVDRIVMINKVDFAQRQAMIFKTDSSTSSPLPLIGKVLAPGDNYAFKLETGFNLALTERYKRGDLLDITQITATNQVFVPFQDAQSVDSYKITASEDSITGKVTLEVQYMPRLPERK